MVTLILQETDSMWRWREVVLGSIRGCGSPFAPFRGGKVLVSLRAEQLLAHWTRLPARPTGPGNHVGVATAT